jgi:hypothetical protein
MNPQIWQAVAAVAVVAVFAALMGGLYAVVTRPLMGRLDDICRRLDVIENRLQNIESMTKPTGCVYGEWVGISSGTSSLRGRI